MTTDLTKPGDTDTSIVVVDVAATVAITVTVTVVTSFGVAAGMLMMLILLLPGQKTFPHNDRCIMYILKEKILTFSFQNISRFI